MPRKAPNGHGSIRQRPDGRWEGRITTGRHPGTGRQVQRSVYGWTQKEVAGKMRELTASIDAGTYMEPARLTVGTWLSTWVKEYTRDLKPLTLVNYEGVIRNHLLPALGGERLEALTAPVIQAYYNSLELAPSTIRGIHAVLHSCLQKAVELGFIRANCSSACKLPRLPKPNVKVLDDVMMIAFLDELRGDYYERPIELDLLTGLRQAEIIGLSWDCVRFDEGVIHLYRQLHRVRKQDEFGPLKNDKPRTVTPPPMAMQLLREQKSEQRKKQLRAGAAWSNKENLVFTHDTGRHLCAGTVYRHIKRIMAKIGMSDADMHTLRHTCATASLRAGVDALSIRDALGHHSTAFTLDTYAHITDMARKENADKMEGFFSALKNGK